MPEDLWVSEFPTRGAVGEVARSRSRYGAPARDDREALPVVADRTDAPGLRARRREPRFEAVENRLWMQWWQDGEYLGRTARLVNVSRHGAMIVSWVLFQEHQRLRIYLEEPAHEVGVHAVVLGVCEGVTGMHQIRLGFISPCPDRFIEAAANGFEAWLDGKRSKD